VIYRQRRVGSQLERDAPQKNAMALFFPSQNTLGELIAAKRRSAGRAGESSDKEHVAIELASRNLEEQGIAKPMCNEKSGA
jgi:hypothetical protein